MIKYESGVLKALDKGKVPDGIFIHLNNAFIAINKTKDLALFDIKKLKVRRGGLRGSRKRNYYRLRKGKYRAIFFIESQDIFVIAIDKREEVYKQWE
ncbi:MAG: hypothetical protein COZ15_03215 [Elusimicrobia bacterium CG_4_10_14_3_um_filter_49_12_50_7]|nr:MAG: hypothetical protein COZ72_07060 [Elusimicrobia bacterium CG_4_8_14_3_um_filter_50_9]PIY17250.1 MAG: hypothetical protein COZ15_03215 [Elusimicrobia bacterium CG_4_10_14_3_um_filter_49_12_50_7]